MRYLNGMLLGALFCFATTLAMAGELDSQFAPTHSDSAMYTMQDVYNRIDDGTEGTKRSGAFTEPSAAPGSTGHTLTELYDLASERSRPACHVKKGGDNRLGSPLVEVRGQKSRNLKKRRT